MEKIEITISDLSSFKDLCPTSYLMSDEYEFHIKDQKNTKSCSACAWITCIEYLRQINGLPFQIFSSKYEHKFACLDRETLNDETNLTDEKTPTDETNLTDEKTLNDRGTSFNTCVEILMCKGAILESQEDMKFIDGKLRILEGAILEILEVNIDLFKIMLSISKSPIVISVYQNQRVLFNSKPQILIENKNNINDCLHAVCLIGYDDKEQVFIYQNSYGPLWHFSGFGKIHYSYINHIRDAQTLNRTCIKDEFDEFSSYGYLCDMLVDYAMNVDR